MGQGVTHLVELTAKGANEGTSKQKIENYFNLNGYAKLMEAYDANPDVQDVIPVFPQEYEFRAFLLDLKEEDAEKILACFKK